MFDTVERHFRILRQVIGDHAGEIFATLGDGVAAAFASADAAVQAAWPPSSGCARPGCQWHGAAPGEAERSGRDYLAAASTPPPASWPPPTAARSWCPT